MVPIWNCKSRRFLVICMMTILYSFLFYNLMETRIYVFVGKKKIFEMNSVEVTLNVNFFFLRIRRGWASAPVQRLLRQRRLICIGRLCVLCRSYFGHFYFALFFTPQPSAVSTFMAFSLYRCVDSTVWMAFIEIVLNFWNRRQLF